jgi:hypothetical protein
MPNTVGLDNLLAAVNAASAKARISWVALLSFGAYLAVAVGATTHRDLFLEQPIALPILGVQLPLVAFYVVAPALFVILHLYLLVNLYDVADRIRFFETDLPHYVPVRADRQRVRARLEPFIVVQHVAGPTKAAVPRFLLALIVWITLVAGPILLLLAFQVRFLPYHSEAVTWLHRGLIATDFFLLLGMIPRILNPSGRLVARVAWSLPSLAPAFFVLIFAIVAATVPDERVEDVIRESSWFIKVPVEDRPASQFQRPEVWWVTKQLFERPIDFATGATTNGFARNLILPDAKFVELDNAPELAERTITLRGRNLRYAVLIGADLRNAEIVASDLRGSRLDGANLSGIRFTCAERPDYECTQLQGASLDDAELQEASLDGFDGLGCRGHH